MYLTLHLMHVQLTLLSCIEYHESLSGCLPAHIVSFGCLEVSFGALLIFCRHNLVPFIVYKVVISVSVFPHMSF